MLSFYPFTANRNLLSGHAPYIQNEEPGCLSQYSVWLRTGRPGDRGSIPGGGERIFPLAFVTRPALGPTQSPFQWVPGFLSPVKRGRGVTLTTHPHVVPRSWISRSYTSCIPSAFVACSGTALLLYTGSRTHLKEVAAEIIWSRKCKYLFFPYSPPFPSYNVLMLMSHLLFRPFKEGSAQRVCWRTYIAEAQLSDSDSITGQKK
jgi:hypothetical protein